uniref:Uncharacterized protein n=2 Tax=Lepeophtheirus salmonis TaxID=72036 RepID=A0A0K2UBF5_LEPSM
MFLPKFLEGSWRSVHNAIPTLFEHVKIKNKSKLPFNRNDAEELQKEQRILMLEHSYAKTDGTSNKEDYLDHEAQTPFSLDIFKQDAPEIEVLTYVPSSSNCINFVAANKSLSAKIKFLASETCQEQGFNNVKLKNQ